MSEKEIVLWYYAHIWKIVYFVGRLIGLRGLGGVSPRVSFSVDAPRPTKMPALAEIALGIHFRLRK